MIRSYLSDIINGHKNQGKWRIHSSNTIVKHKTQGEWKINLTMAINFLSSKEGLEESMRGNEFIFDRVDALYYNHNEISLSGGESYIDSPEWLKNKKATINTKNDDDKCF